MQGRWRHLVPKRTKRWLVVRKLRSQLRVDSFRRGFARFWAIECSAAELAEIEGINQEELISVGKFLQRRLCVQGRLPEVSILCFGSDTPIEKVPMLLRRLLTEFYGGCWFTEIRAVVVGFGDRRPIRRIVRHELTHGLLELLTGGFRYSMAIQEGFAGYVEYKLGQDTDRQHASSKRKRRYWKEDDVVTIKELLACRYEAPQNPNYHRMAYLCYCLNAYLARISKQQPELRRILQIIWRKNLQEPEAVYAWLQETSGLTPEELEDGFRRFCLSGRAN